MAPVDGWYPDPAGMPQLRFWDGQNWTAATAPAPVTQSYAPQTVTMPPRGAAPSGGSPTHRAPKRGKGFYGIIAGIAAVAVGVAVIIPLTSGGSHHAPPTAASFKGVLLSVGEVSETTALPFAVDNSSDDSSGDDPATSCVPLNNVQKAETAAEKADVDQSFVSKQTGLQVDEELTYLPGKAAAVLTAFQSAFEQCSTYTFGTGDTVKVAFLPGASVKGSDAVMAIQETATISGTPMISDALIVRFGDTIISISCSGSKAPQNLNQIAQKLLQQAAEKAKPVL